MAAPLIVKSGDKFHRLTLVEELARQNRMRVWRVRCDCGTEFDTLQKNFLSGGNRRSCGCTNRKATTHGKSNAPEYRHWVNMISRAENPNTPSFEHYGGRGIRVCEHWRSDFMNFYGDMGPRPSPKHSIDRIDVNGDYEPSNCRWASSRVQSRNKRTNRIIVFRGRNMPLADAVPPENYNTVLYRLKRGWTLEAALTRPIQRKAHK